MFEGGEVRGRSSITRVTKFASLAHFAQRANKKKIETVRSLRCNQKCVQSLQRDRLCESTSYI